MKTESLEYDLVDESYLSKAQMKLMKLTNEGIHELPENDRKPLPIIKLDRRNPLPIIKLESYHRCYQCQEEFQTSESLKNHIIAYTKNNLIIPHMNCVRLNQSQGKQNNLASQKLLNGNKEHFTCEVCYKTFEKKCYLILHKKIHLDGRYYKCEVCGRKLKSASFLKVHMRLHTGEKPYECDICKKKLKYLHTLKLHIQAHKSRPHKCSHCSMSFTKVQHLDAHMLIHSGLKNFKCRICKQAFIRKDILKSHMLIHKKEKCFVCNVCNKSFAKKTYLTEHKKIHKDKKPYLCKICGKGFIYLFYLNTHLRTHTGEKPYECDICQQKFSRRCSVTKHKNRVHAKVYKTSKFSDNIAEKFSTRKRNFQRTACENDAVHNSMNKKKEIIGNLEEQKETFIGSETSILFSVKKEPFDPLDLSSEIEFSDVKIECEYVENEFTGL